MHQFVLRELLLAVFFDTAIGMLRHAAVHLHGSATDPAQSALHLHADEAHAHCDYAGQGIPMGTRNVYVYGAGATRPVLKVTMKARGSAARHANQKAVHSVPRDEAHFALTARSFTTSTPPLSTAEMSFPKAVIRRLPVLAKWRRPASADERPVSTSLPTLRLGPRRRHTAVALNGGDQAAPAARASLRSAFLGTHALKSDALDCEIRVRRLGPGSGWWTTQADRMDRSLPTHVASFPARTGPRIERRKGSPAETPSGSAVPGATRYNWLTIFSSYALLFVCHPLLKTA